MNKKFLITLVAIAVFIIAIVMSIAFIKIDDIEVQGNEQCTDQEIKDYIFDGAFDDSLIVFWLKNKFMAQADIPFVQKYEIEFNSFHSVKVQVYEKSLVGYIDYVGTCMYFDKDGIVVESSSEPIEGIPEITGIQYDYVLLHEKIPVTKEKIFSLILNVTQAVSKYDLTVEKIYISPKYECTLYLGQVKVNLGDEEDLVEKISTLKDMESQLEGHSGTLDLSVLNDEGTGYILKNDTYKDSEKETESQVEESTSQVDTSGE